MGTHRVYFKGYIYTYPFLWQAELTKSAETNIKLFYHISSLSKRFELMAVGLRNGYQCYRTEII